MQVTTIGMELSDESLMNGPGPKNNKFLKVHILKSWVWSALKVENLAWLYLKIYIQHKQLTLP